MITYRKDDAPKGVAFAHEVLESVFENLDGPFWIAGGAVLEAIMFGTRTTDVDLFFRTDEDRALVVGQLVEQEADLLVRGKRVIKYAHPTLGKVDIIRKNYADPLACIGEFDFTVACGAVDRDETFYCHDEYFDHIGERSLALQGTPFPISTLSRVEKYVRKGFALSHDATIELARALQSADVDAAAAEFY